MKKLLFAVLIFLFVKEGVSQSIITLSPGSNFFISAGTTVSFDSLVLIPSAGISVRGTNQLSKTKTALHQPATAYVRSVFGFATPTAPFSGTVIFRYADAVLNGIPEDALTLNVYDGQQWKAFETNITRVPVSNIVITRNLSNVNLNEITLAADYVLSDGFTSLRPVRNDVRNRLQLYPNPATANVTVLMTATQNNTATLTVINAAGEKVQQVLKPLTKGNNLFTLNVENLPAGMYTLSVLQNGETKSLRFVKQ